MKGVIIDYFEDKGFGFIKDEKEHKRFFHIYNIKEKNLFLDNITDYYYTDWVDRNCFVINFFPSQNEKGLNALNIDLTNQIFNDKSSILEFEAIVTNLKYDTESLTKTVSGISKNMSKPFGVTAGSNGTYRIGYPEVLKEVNIYFRRNDDIGWGTINVRDLALKINDRSKITNKFIQTLSKNIIGKTIKVIPNKNRWDLKEVSILKV